MTVTSIPLNIDRLDLQPVSLTGQALLENSLLNKGTAFTDAERDAFELQGLLPAHISTLEEQVIRAYEQYQQKETDLERNIYLTNLHDTNETLFFKLMQEYATEMVPMIYTPIEAIAIERFSHIYRKPRGLFISYPERSKLKQMIANYPNPNIEAIVVTDAERILGIGDQGVGGIGIAVGKLAIYTVFLVEGMQPNRKQIDWFLQESLMLVTALSPVIGYDKASEIAHYAFDHNLSLRDAALKLRYVTAEAFDQIVDPLKMTQIST